MEAKDSKVLARKKRLGFGIGNGAAVVHLDPVVERLSFRTITGGTAEPTFLDEVDRGLSLPQKSLPSRFLYDEVGSKLFEAITELPEYYVTRIDESILERYAQEIVAAMDEGFAMVEFGSGSSRKTRLLIEAALARQGQLQYLPIDISGQHLRESSIQLLQQYSEMSIVALAAEYGVAVRSLPPTESSRLFLFLGSNIGNFDHDDAVAFLGKIRQQMGSRDRILIGVDLVKDPAVIELAYNDPAGVTAAFDKNILARINRELGGDFSLACFEHFAPWIPEQSRIEMRLVSKRRQSVTISSLKKTFHFEQGEYIHTENSHKYSEAKFAELCAEAGLRIERGWTDPKSWFSVMLLEPGS